MIDLSRRHLAALRALLVLTVLCGVLYPLAVAAIGRLPGLRDKADGSYVRVRGRDVGSSLIGQRFTDERGNPLRRYFQSRPSSAGDGYDPTATSASNLGPESVVDGPARRSLLSTVCARSRAVGALEGVDGSRPYCTGSGVGAVLSVLGPRDAMGRVRRPAKVISVNEPCPATPFMTTYRGVEVECRAAGQEYRTGQLVPVRGDAPGSPAVPADAVTASGSGLDPHVSTAYARLQARRVARTRGLPLRRVERLIDAHTAGRALGFLGEPAVNVLELNLALDEITPSGG